MVQRRDDKLIHQVVDKLREIRKARNLSQAAVYEDTGIHIAKIESKGTNLTVTALSILCKYYEIPLEEFFKGIDGSDDMI